MMRRWGSKGIAGLFILGLASASCATLLGIDEDYHAFVGEGGGSSSTTSSATGSTNASGGGGSGVSDTGTLGTLGAPCPQVGVLACAGNAQKSKLICGTDEKWATNGTCDGDTLCDTTEGIDQGTCKSVVVLCAGKSPAEVVCDGLKRVKCGPDLVTSEELETCPYACSAGACVVLPHCTGVAATCGPKGDEDCCASPLVTGGTYNRSNDANYPATVNDFRLDRFEITVGRFRAFVAAYPGSKPAKDAGAHPFIGGSGWDATWDMNLPADQAALLSEVKCQQTYSTWTDAPGANENLPMDCISWYAAFAFCAWDGGRLPTEAEWDYAAAGGSEQREYPWGSAAPDANHAVYDCTGDGSAPGPMNCSPTDILKVGSKPAGDGKWGQADLAGSMFEFNLDWKGAYSNPCNNCANIQADMYRLIRGGCWNYGAVYLPSSFRSGNGTPTVRYVNAGARCARTP